MKIISVTAAVLVFFAESSGLAAALCAQAPLKERAGLERIREADLRADLAFIASDGLEGRMSLQPGDAAATQWVAAEFAKAGLEPAAVDALDAPSFLQEVPIVEYRPNRSANFISLTGEGRHRWGAGDVFGGYRDDVEITAPLTFVGYGITAPGLGYDDYRGVDVHGKIVLAFDHEPQENDPRSRFNGTGNTRYATTRIKAQIAQAHGALALVIMTEPNRKHLTNVERSRKIGGSLLRDPPLPIQALAGDDLHIPVITVTDMVEAEFLEGAGASPSALQAGIDADLQPRSRDLAGKSLKLHLENVVRTRGSGSNVAGLLRGSDPTLAAETVIISAHHDHDGATAGGSEIWRGADDNGSGTVGVVELARAFAANPVRPRRSILFVVFAAEERGLLGAYFMAAHPLRPLNTTRAMINFDMIGRNEAASDQTEGLIIIPKDTTNRLNLIGGTYSPDFRRAVATANLAVGLDLDDRFDHESALNVFFRSDQFPFVLHDVPAFWFFTGFHPDYHHVTDTADKINYVKMTKILKLAYLSAFKFGDDAKVPAFVPDPPGTP